MSKDIENVELPEIEVTPEMIEAGASVLFRMETAFAREEFWAEEVFRAMAILAPVVRSTPP